MNQVTRIALVLSALVVLPAQTAPQLVGLGDSIGEGIQSLDASIRTQPNSYLNLIAKQLGVPFPLPLINTSVLGVGGSTIGRSRIDPTVRGYNLAVNGADTESVLNQFSSLPVSNETDLVLLPRLGSQVSIAESMQAPLVICWIGNNDILSAVTSFDKLDASQITPPNIFDANFQQIVSRLNRPGTKLVFANIPEVRSIGFLFNREDLIAFLGSDYGLPQGSYTTLAAVTLIKTGMDDGSILQNPDWVLDPAELQTIANGLAALNQIIAARAAAVNAPVVDVYSYFTALAQNPPTIGNVTLSRRYLGGMFSLDGAHPSNIGHALVANAFIQVLNQRFSMNVPELTPAQLESITLQDPFVDFDGDLRVKGRFGAGLLETLAPFIGFSGDANTPISAQRFLDAYTSAKGLPPMKRWTKQDAIAVLHDVFRFK